MNSYEQRNLFSTHIAISGFWANFADCARVFSFLFCCLKPCVVEIVPLFSSLYQVNRVAHMAVSVLFPYPDSVPKPWSCNRKNNLTSYVFIWKTTMKGPKPYVCLRKVATNRPKPILQRETEDTRPYIIIGCFLSKVLFSNCCLYVTPVYPFLPLFAPCSLLFYLCLSLFKKHPI